MRVYQHPELAVETMGFRDACAAAGLNCNEVAEGWRIDCCGEPCHVGSGICGGDVVSCMECGASVRNIASPHINRGMVVERLLADGVYETCWLPRTSGDVA